MYRIILTVLCLVFIYGTENPCDAADAEAPPHIVFIVADDLGWNDVGFHGSNQIPTPNIDALAYNGIMLNSHYVQSMCTPSRSALLTGKYPMRLGMQGDSITPGENRALPDTEKILPEWLKDLGYSTHLVGKWHLGYSRWNDTPTQRGFDTHFGYYNGHVSYYDYLNTKRVNEVDYTGFDLRRDHLPAWDVVGKYATDAFTEHAVSTIQEHDTTKPMFMLMSHLGVHAGNDGKLLEAPQEAINKFKYIVDANRRTYAAMVSKLDDSVGSVVEALQAKGMLQNSVIAFITDNGAPTVGEFMNWGSNYPLRGIKHTLFEGGVRGVACIWSPLLVQTSRVHNELVHISDWLPTLYAAAGGDTLNLEDIDGIDQWSTLVYDLPSARTDALLNIDEKTRNAALRFYNWKLIVGTTFEGQYNKYFGESGKRNTHDMIYNTTSVYNSLVGINVRLAGYNEPTSEAEYLELRRDSTVKCLPPKGKKNFCDPATGSVCLYDIPNDPCEENNLAPYFSSVVRRMKRALVDYRSGLSAQLNQEPDISKADPKLFDYTWNPWMECSDLTCSS